jgi:acetolactate synthase-1/3 small subunit
MKHVISMLMENESGALSRVSGLFSARGYNIHALTVAPTEDESLSRLTLVTSGTEMQIEQIVKHLNRLIHVVKVLDLTEGSHIERELMLIKLSATGDMREEYKRLADIFRGDIVDVTATTYTVQMVGESKKLDAFIGAIDPALILETVRSGTVGVLRGEKCLHL